MERETFRLKNLEKKIKKKIAQSMAQTTILKELVLFENEKRICSTYK